MEHGCSSEFHALQAIIRQLIAFLKVHDYSTTLVQIRSKKKHLTNTIRIDQFVVSTWFRKTQKSTDLLNLDKSHFWNNPAEVMKVSLCLPSSKDYLHLCSIECIKRAWMNTDYIAFVNMYLVKVSVGFG